MQESYEFIDPLQLRPCLDVPTHSYAFCVAEEGIMGNADHLQSPRFLIPLCVCTYPSIFS